MQIGDVVSFKDVPGTVRFIGKTEFAQGVWIGVELNTADGKNDGSVGDVQYFKCKPNYGVFVRENSLITPGGNVSRESSPLASNDASKMTAVIDKLQVKTKAMRQEIQSLNEKIGELETSHNDLSEELELSTIEKETLQEHNELLDQEIQELKQINLNLKTQLSELSRELKLNSQSLKTGSVEKLSIENIKLNERVTQLHSQNAELETELKSIRGKLIKLNDIHTKYERVSNELSASKSIVEELTSNLEITKQSSSIIENLTLKNLSLTEENATLQESVKEFEDLKKIEAELDRENNQLLGELSKEIAVKDLELQDKESLIKTLKTRITTLQPKENLQEDRKLETSTPAPNDELYYQNQDLQNSLKNLQLDKQNLLLDIQFLKFKLTNSEKLLGELVSNITKDPRFYKVKLDSYKAFIQNLDEFIKLENGDHLVDLLSVRVKSELKLLSAFIETSQQSGSLSTKEAVTKIDEFLTKVVDLIKEGDHKNLFDELILFDTWIRNVSIPDDFQFKKRLTFETFLRDELIELQLIQQVIEVFHSNEVLADNFKKLFRVSKGYEKLIISSLTTIENAKQNNDELLISNQESFSVITLDEFFEKLSLYASTGNGLVEVNDSINKLSVDIEPRQQNFKNDFTWEHKNTVALETDKDIMTNSTETFSKTANDTKSIQVEELQLKIEVLNSKLENYKQLSSLINEYKSKTQNLTSENKSLSQSLSEAEEQISKYSEIISQSSNSLILQNLEFESLIEFKSKLEKVDLISEIQTLRRTVKYQENTLSQKRKNSDLSWLRVELPKYKPFGPTENLEINELRQLGKDMRRRLERI